MCGGRATDAQRPGRQGGLGLLGIRERVTQLGGTIRIDSGIGRGTRLEVSIPIPEGRADMPPGRDDTVAIELDEVHHG